jgi:hypothetical protein
MSTVKLHVLARFPRDYDREAANADKRHHAIEWMRQHAPTEATAVHGTDGLLKLVYDTADEADALHMLAGGA